MVKGIQLFSQHFRRFTDCYVIIGDTACDLLFSELGLAFRATRDIDIIIRIDQVSDSFYSHFWQFIKAGNYMNRNNSQRPVNYYRFTNPLNKDYPFMIEIFSKRPTPRNFHRGSHLTPIATGPDISSLSAILLDDAYYKLLCSGQRLIKGITVAGAAALIPLKARAYLDLTGRKDKNEKIDSKTIRKHRNDVFRLFNILEPDPSLSLSDSIRSDLTAFLIAMDTETIVPKQFGLGSISKEAIIDELARFYGCR